MVNLGNIARLLLLLAVVLLSLLTLAPYAARLYRLLEVPSGFRVQLLVLSLIVGVLSLPFLRGLVRSAVQRMIMALLAICLVVNGLEVLQWVMPHPQPEVQGPGLKVLAFNVLGSNQQTNAVVEYVRSEEPDVALFYEAVDHWPGALAGLAETHPHHVPVQVCNFEVFSRYPVLDHQLYFFGDYRGFLVMTLDVDGTEVELVAYHAYPSLYYGQRGFDLRNQQLDGLVKIPRTPGKPTIVMGDFNVDIWSPWYRKMIRASGLRDARRGQGVLPSHSPNVDPLWFALAGRPIDLCLVDNQVAVDKLKTGPRLGSDHLPVVVELRVPDF